MRLVEDVERVGIADLRALENWNVIRKAQQASIVVLVDGRQHPYEVKISADNATFGRRFWLTCPERRCGFSRRRFLHIVQGRLVCRRCGGLRYWQQTWPGSRWRKTATLLKRQLDDCV